MSYPQLGASRVDGGDSCRSRGPGLPGRKACTGLGAHPSGAAIRVGVIVGAVLVLLVALAWYTRIWERASMRLPYREAVKVQFDPTGRYVAVADRGGPVQVYSVDRRQPRWPLLYDRVASLAFSPDGESAVTGGMDGKIRVHVSASGHVRATLGPREKPVTAVGISADATTVVTLDQDGLCRWNAATGQLKSKQPVKFGLTAINSGATHLAREGPGNSIEVVDLASGDTCWRKSGLPHLSCLGFSSDGRTLAVACDMGVERTSRVYLWDVKSGTESPFLECNEVVVALSLSRDARRVATSSSGCRFHVWDLSARSLVTACTSRYTRLAVDYYSSDRSRMEAPVTALSPDGTLLATPGDQDVGLWRI